MTEKPSPIYLMLPREADDAFMRSRLATLLQRMPVGAVLFWAGVDRLPAAEAALSTAHRFQVPLLLAGPIAASMPIPADGVHVESTPAELKTALNTHSPRLMVGAGGLWNRHDAMLSGESGVDYVFFGTADPDRTLDHDRICDLCGWWSGLFEIPCVGAASTLDEARHLLAAGAEFVGLRDAVWNLGDDAADALASLHCNSGGTS